MRILVVNSGSSSIKFQLFDMKTHNWLCKGLMERIGLKKGIFTYTAAGKDKIVEELPIPDHKVGLQKMLQAITDPKTGVIQRVDDIQAVGHRIVHGGDKITSSMILDDEAIRNIEACIPLAPLHNPANLMGVTALKELLPNRTPHVGAFDTAFHASMPRESFLYAIPFEYYTKHNIRRFGFHGTSHQYVTLRAAEMLKAKPDDFQCVTVHLGNGSSLAAVKGGRSVDTSLGFGTMCGVPMGTRAGDVDPAIIMYLIEELGLSPKAVDDILYKKSGLLGLTGLSSDMRDVEAAAEGGNEHCRMALAVLTHNIAKYICALASNLDRLDAIVFTAGIGEHSVGMRASVAKNLKVLGVKLDTRKNREKNGTEAVISAKDSAVPVLIVPTNEELMIALDTERLVTEND